MLIVSGVSRTQNCQSLAREFRRPRVPSRLIIHGSTLALASTPWRDFWDPCRLFMAEDSRLIYRLNQLKGAWLNLLRNPSQRLHALAYCWRYFGLLHNALSIARTDRRRCDPLGTLRQILSFEIFPLQVHGEGGVAACTTAGRNPVFLLGQIGLNAAIPSPRHVPLVLPVGHSESFYHYRQILVRGAKPVKMLLSPSIELQNRANSFGPIDRFARVVSESSDPFWKPRAKLLARRILAPLHVGWQKKQRSARMTCQLRILDLGAGTGHMAVNAWGHLGRLFPKRRPTAAFHFVDNNAPAFGRSFGVSRVHAGITHVEWTTANYRELLDDDNWLARCGPFDWVFACRLFDNASNFFIERIDVESEPGGVPSLDCLPHLCLAPHRQPGGVRCLMVAASRRRAGGGTTFPQFSLRDYFAAMLAVQVGSLDAVSDDGWYLPVRRFNPAALLTAGGRSVLAQLMKISDAVIIEDVDVEPEHLRQHREQFGLSGTAAVHCIRDGFATSARYYVVTSPSQADDLRGERLW